MSAEPGTTTRRRLLAGAAGVGAAALLGPTAWRRRSTAPRGARARTKPASPYTRYWGFAGLPEGRVLFGGEHTALSAQGFLEGAVRSGERCAAEAAALAR